MAATRIMPIHLNKGGTPAKALSDVIGYVGNPEKTDKGYLISSFHCSKETAAADFMLLRQSYLQRTGWKPKKGKEILAYHVRQSFSPGEITPQEANRLGQEFARRFTKDKYAVIVCTHVDKAHIHNHIVWSSTKLDGTGKFQNFWNSEKAVQKLSDMICLENGYSVIENPGKNGKTYDQWLSAEAKPTNKDILRKDISKALSESPQNLDALFSLLEKNGYEIKNRNGKNPSFRKPGNGQERFMRLDSLGENYTPESLSAVIAGTKKFVPVRWKESEAGNLLIDIQEKMREGKGAGYEKWATTYNLKQMAQTLLFLQERKLVSFAALDARIEEVTTRTDEILEKSKAVQKRMDEIKALREQIINYQKTRQIYVEYRKSGYSEKFYEQHRAEITLHKAAKKYFDEQRVQKLPSLKELNEEYNRLLTEERASSPEYRKLRDEWKELVTARSNLKHFLNRTEKGQNEKVKKRNEPER